MLDVNIITILMWIEIYNMYTYTVINTCKKCFLKVFKYYIRYNIGMEL